MFLVFFPPFQPVLEKGGLFPGEMASYRASHGAMVTLSGPAGKVHLPSSRLFLQFIRKTVVVNELYTQVNKQCVA